MRKLFAGLIILGLLAGCQSPSTTVVSADAAYSTFAEAEVAYATSGVANPALAQKLLVADNALHDALKALSQAVESGNSNALHLAYVAAQSEVGNIQPIVQSINSPTLTAALATISATVATVQAQSLTPSTGN